MKTRKKHQIHIIVVGAGASGLLAAISAARSGARVTVLEQKEKIGKKILATGNGHCNFTNMHMSGECYHGNSFAMDVIRQFDVTQTLKIFQEIGIFPHERNGYYYPASEQAQAVVALLEQEAVRLGVGIKTDTRVQAVQKSGDQFQISTVTAIKSGLKETVKKNGKKKITAGEIRYENGQVTGDCVILACGGKASPVLGSDGSGYELARFLGHRIVKPLPALTGIRCQEAWFKQLAGVRISARVTILADGKKQAEEEGELQLTDYGISGIPVFQVSRHAARALDEGKNVEAELCFYPEISEDSLSDYLRNHEEDAYCGLYPDKLLYVLRQLATWNKGGQRPSSVERRKKLQYLTRHLRCTCQEVNGFDRAQVTCGGVSLKEVDPDTLESRICPGVYFAGELLDVDGICGGYNLQWAWSSGWIAGQAAAKQQR